ncbi:hypothetical protein HK102_012737 [Quaeritorhiza haematococci]|nr:hypothetical protein HK102_012737 [Quaeritorhiza haematococci]
MSKHQWVDEMIRALTAMESDGIEFDSEIHGKCLSMMMSGPTGQGAKIQADRNRMEKAKKKYLDFVEAIWPEVHGDWEEMVAEQREKVAELLP